MSGDSSPERAIRSFEALADELRRLATVILDPGRWELTQSSETSELEIIRGARYANEFRTTFENIFEKAKLVWEWQDLAIDVFQEMFVLDQYNRYLFVDFDFIDFEEERDSLSLEWISFCKLQVKQNAGMMLEAHRLVSANLLRLAGRIEAHAFVLVAPSPDDAELLMPKRRKKENMEIERLYREEGVDDINLLMERSGATSAPAVRQFMSRLKRQIAAEQRKT